MLVYRALGNFFFPLSVLKKSLTTLIGLASYLQRSIKEHLVTEMSGTGVSFKGQEP